MLIRYIIQQVSGEHCLLAGQILNCLDAHSLMGFWWWVVTLPYCYQQSTFHICVPFLPLDEIEMNAYSAQWKKQSDQAKICMTNKSLNLKCPLLHLSNWSVYTSSPFKLKYTHLHLSNWRHKVFCFSHNMEPFSPSH